MTMREIIEKRKRLRVTQVELAEAIGVKPYSVITIEKYEVANPEMIARMDETIERIARDRLGDCVGCP